MKRKSIDQRARECVREIRKLDEFAATRPVARTEATRNLDHAGLIALAIRKAIEADRRARSR